MAATRSPRTRRRATGSPLPRPAHTEGPTEAIERAHVAPPKPAARVREHHVTNDFSYVHGDLAAVAAIGAVALAFIVGMSFIV